MYHHHSQQQGSQGFSSGPRPSHHQPPPNHQQNRPASDMLSQSMGFQFPRPTQLPDELESALAIRGARDMDHRSIEHMSLPNSHQNQGSSSGISQHGGYNSNPMTLTSDSQPSHQQGVDWSSYQPPAKLFASAPHSTGHPSSHSQGPHQQAQSTHAGTGIQNWGPPAKDVPSPQARHPHSGSGDGQGLYTPESAGSILASFGLSNEDLEVLSHYPDDQLTPDTLPFILRDIQINKSGSKKTVPSNSASTFSRNIHDMLMTPSCSSPLTRSRSPEVPSLLTVTQTAGKVIDYGHASRTKEDNTTRETFKREPLSGERTVKMYSSSSSVSCPKVDKIERQVRMEHLESSKHGDRDYRRTSNDHRKNSLSNEREVPLSTKSRNMDRDYRSDGLKPRPSSETRAKTSSRRSLSSSSGTKPQSTSKMLPTPTMISDFSAVSPKVYPHTCSLCHTQCDQEKDWVDHINTVNHTAACRDLRNKYPEWKPHPTSPPPSKYRVDTHGYKPHGRPYPLPHHARHHHYTGGSSHSGLKRPYEEPSKRPTAPRVSQSYKHGPPQTTTKVVKSYTKPETKTVKTASSKNDTSAKATPLKKKKKIVLPASQDSSIAGRLVYLTGIPKNASEQDVTDLVGSFGKINNVILMPCSEEESQKGEGQKASVCMVKAEDAQALANSTNLTIQDQQITTSIAKKCEVECSTVDSSRKNALESNKQGSRQDSGDSGMKTPDEKGTVLITGLPEGGWSECDVVKLVQPFGTPSDIIIAAQIRKVLVSVPDMETAQEIVKVHTFIPAKINDTELKITHVKQNIGIKTPVALYNLLMGTVDPLETLGPVGWGSLLVISNVPDTPSASCEVEKLVRRFGTLIKTLVLNNMVICEMATAAMAMSVYKRFQKFPCILQNNPLFFSRKPDPKVSIQAKVIAAYADSSALKETPTNGKESNAKEAEDGEEMVPKESSASQLETMDQKEVEGSEQAASRDEVSGDNQKKEVKSTQNASMSTVSECPAASEADGNETSAVDGSSDMQTTKSEAGNDSSAREDTSTEAATAELPTMTQEMVTALLVECRTRTSSNPNKTEACNDGEQVEPQTVATEDDTAAEEMTELDTNQTEEVQKQEKERKEREAKIEKEVRERERKEKERRAWEKEERAKREREERERRLRERDRREWEKERIRRERERRERKRPYAEGARPSYRSEGYRPSTWKDQQPYNCEAETSKQEEVEEEEECDEFPFNLSDFITVDEVGDVADLPQSPSVPMETTDGIEDKEDTQAEAATEDTVKDTMEESMEATTHDTVKDIVIEATTDDTMKDTVDESMEVTLKELPEDTVNDTAETPSDTTAVRDITMATSHSATPSSSQTSTQQQGAPGTATGDATSKVPTSPAPTTSGSPKTTSSDSSAAPQTPKQVSADDGEVRLPHHSQVEEEEEKEKMVVVLETAKDEVKSQSVEDQTAPGELKGSKKNPDEEIPKSKVVPETCMSKGCLPPFDPNNPVGLEYLVPKTGFFCKVCNRFFSGNKEAEISHCRSFKHYENLQKYLETSKALNGNTKPKSS